MIRVGAANGFLLAGRRFLHQIISVEPGYPKYAGLDI